MCRIAGFWDFNYHGEYSLEGVAIEMRDTLSHGGPDDAGLYVEPSIGLALTHRRLAILDLSPLGHQPMEFDNLVITYNGEVYNFMEIRQELEREGYSFVSNSDTEVVLKAFHRWGLEALHRFRGMFAIALWNRKNNTLTLIRDRLGVKPLYYYYRDGFFAFASELKAFHKHPKFKKELEPLALVLYLQYGYITAPYCIFKNTYKLEPGHYLVVDGVGSLNVVEYWSVETYFQAEPIDASEEEITRELEALLIESFKLRMVSDVPVGIFLSGGLDSTTVTALLQNEMTQPLKTFTIGFYEKDYNEAEYAKRIAQYLGTDHTELYCSPKDAMEIIPKLPEIYDEPFGDPSAIPTYLVSKLARNKVKVSLSADGGDEQFCGYTRYWVVGERIAKLNKFPLLGVLAKILDLVNPDMALAVYNTLKPLLPKWTNFRDKYIKLRNILKRRDLFNQYDLSNMYFLPEDIKEISTILSEVKISQLFKLNGIYLKEGLNFMMLYDMKTYLPDDILVKVDRATMSVSLEGREPLLDHKLVEYTARIPVELKYRDGKSKYILRKILYKYVPPELVDRPKMGFGVPIYEWFRGEMGELYKSYLDPNLIGRDKIFNPAEVEKLVKNYFENKGVNHNKLWLLLVFQLWKEKWL